MDYYAILGISQGASKEDIKKAYHKMAHKHHPDKGGDVKEFHKITEAYNYLIKLQHQGGFYTTVHSSQGFVVYYS